MGRVNLSNITSSGILMAYIGLSQHNVEIREASLRFIEDWNLTAARENLEIYIKQEKISWLAEYASQVLESLCE